MDMSVSKKVLNVAAIFDYIAGGLTLLVCIMTVVIGITGMSSAEFAQSLPATLGAAAFTGFGVYLGFEALLSFITGYLSRRAVKDPSKIMPVWVISLVSLVLSAGDLLIQFYHNVPVSEMGGEFFSLAIAAVIFAAANSIKTQVGK